MTLVTCCSPRHHAGCSMLCGRIQESQRQVSREQGQEFARQHGCLFVETSAKTNLAVSQAFEELVLKILDTPNLLDQAPGTKLQASKEKPYSSSCCWVDVRNLVHEQHVMYHMSVFTLVWDASHSGHLRTFCWVRVGSYNIWCWW